MGYQSIENLYKRSDFLECYALEKVEGTSAHIAYQPKREIPHERDSSCDVVIPESLTFYAGGASKDVFEALFDKEALLAKFREIGFEGPVTIYGEAYGGKIMGMSKYYGPDLKFIAFEVKMGERWMPVPLAQEIVESFGLRFVPYEKGPRTLEWVDSQRDRPSLVAIVPNAPREGVVLRPIWESKDWSGSRVMAKHKRAEFRETVTERKVGEDPGVLEDAEKIATEWVTQRRLSHVLQKVPFRSMSDAGAVIKAMIADVEKESAGEILWRKSVHKAITKETVRLLQTIPSEAEAA